MHTNLIKTYTDFIFVNSRLESADIIFVPGNSFPQMAQRAAELYHEGLAPYILPSGRYGKLVGAFDGSGEFDTEWEFLADVLRRGGVPEKAILREDQATYTYENAIFSRQVTDSMGLKISRAILCCKSWHARRSLLYYQLLYPDTEFMVCGVDVEITRDDWYQSERGIDLVLGEIERCGTQFHEILKSGLTPHL